MSSVPPSSTPPAGPAPELAANHVARGIALGVAAAAVSVCHYVTPASYFHWHVLYERLYYLPILFAAFWYGLRGGLSVAAATAVLYLPHIVLHWGHAPLYRSNQLAELAMFLVVGSAAGVLSDRIRREREQHRRTAEELRAAYAQLQATFERLRLVDRLSALGALSARMAHEIKNPLGSILGSIEILESSVPTDAERREFVAILKKEVERLADIVSSRLDLVRAGKPERGPYDLGQVARSVVDLVRKQAEHQSVVVHLHVAEGLPTALVDGPRMRQAILNLVINAVEALPPGGTVDVSVARDGERLAVIVEDDGPGLDPSALERAFEPFFTTKERGTGLGLSIAFQIAAQHGGDLRATNRESGGARFRLEVPLRASPENRVAAEGART